ncbi:hypothetical protein BJY04DRAFT_116938 [Aspergillus karnatakaensis]|uniref:uncharacterized protein n=1 Tax=Aspergillus karnatakaensis TaxID=1810916 RepID=UPI003CCD3B9C
MPRNLGNLSPELVDLIIHYLHDLKFLNPEVPLTPTKASSFLPKDEKLSRYSTISRQWQYAVERYTFAHLTLSSGTLQQLNRIVGSCPRRIQLVKNLGYTVNLPAYSRNRRSCVERRGEHEENLRVFRTGVVDIFALIKSWEKHISPVGLGLNLRAEAPGEHKRESAERNEFLGLEVEEPQEEEEESWGIGADRWAHRDHSLTLNDDSREAPALPILPFVNGLGIGSMGRRIHPVAIEQMILALPNLKDLSIRLPPVKPKRKALRAELRNALAKALEAPTLSQLEFLGLELDEPTPVNHNFETALERDPDFPKGDHLSRAICKLAQRSLKNLEILKACVISPVLWGLDPLHQDREGAIFPHLEMLAVDIAHITYDGRWYFTGNPEDADYDEDEIEEMMNETIDDNPDIDSKYTTSSFNSEDNEHEIDEDREAFLNGEEPYYSWRRTPDPELFNPLVKGLVSATMRMPKLKQALVSTFSLAEEARDIEFHFVVPGELIGDSSGFSVEATKTEWHVTPRRDSDWKLPDDIRRMMEKHVGKMGEVIVD